MSEYENMTNLASEECSNLFAKLLGFPKFNVYHANNIQYCGSLQKPKKSNEGVIEQFSFNHSHFSLA